MAMALQDEIRCSDASRYDHRLHGVLLVAQGMTCPQVAELLGDAPRTVVNWVQRFESDGLAGLSEGQRSGRPSRLNEKQLARVEAALRSSPTEFGLPTQMWDGPALSEFLGPGTGSAVKDPAMPAALPPTGFSVAQAPATGGKSRSVIAGRAQKNSTLWRETAQLTCGQWTRSTFNNTARVAACGCRRK
jgi:transposase